jgi:hypothetical protein
MKPGRRVGGRGRRQALFFGDHPDTHRFAERRVWQKWCGFLAVSQAARFQHGLSEQSGFSPLRPSGSMPEGLRTPVGIIQQASQQLDQHGVVFVCELPIGSLFFVCS